MPYKLTAVLLTLVLIRTRALILDTPTEVITGEDNRVFFQDQPGDHQFTLLLTNPSLDENLALVALVDPTAGSVAVDVPCFGNDQ